MERVLTPDEKLRRAEEIYYKKRGTNVNFQNKTVNVPVSNQKYLFKKMIIQIVICFIIYCSYYVIKNFNFIFSKDVIDKTSAILTYDINVQEIYCKVANYINNYSYIKENAEETNLTEKQDESTNEILTNQTDELVTEGGTADISETKVETLSATETFEEVPSEESSINQMQADANDIKQTYSLINPLKGQITSRFGVRAQTQSIISPYHVGVDIAANTGTVIVASMEGSVVFSGELDGYGKCIQIQKDDVLTIYGHCSKLYINNGDVITQGQQIAEVGSTGNSTGPHLHFEIRKSGRYVDPELIFAL